MDISIAAPDMIAQRRRMHDLWLADEARCVETLIPLATVGEHTRERIRARASDLVMAVRAARSNTLGVDAFLQQYDLSSQEGVVLMCLAEALLRIPDAETVDRLIEEKLTSAHWEAHLSASDSLLVNASTWGLMLAGRILQLDEGVRDDVPGYLRRLAARAGEPLIREAIRQAVRILGHQFVMGRSIAEALKRSRSAEQRDFHHSFDMLGEAALTAEDAQAYFDAYASAIDAIGESAKESTDVHSAPSVSVKLSALHPRYEYAQRERVLRELAPRLRLLAERARSWAIGLTVDAEEADRLELSLDLFDAVYRSPALAGYDGFGLAVQAYQKRGTAVVEWLIALSQAVGRRIPVRLVKGAYWDTEIKRAQEHGLDGYPVFTRKASTDVSYLACARRLLEARKDIYPMFATHNAHTLASILEIAGELRDFEFQRLHGMGEELYAAFLMDPARADPTLVSVPCRVYAPVGSHEALLPYLVRRLLENGANTSFVHRIVDPRVPVSRIVADPVEELSALSDKAHPDIALPRRLFGDCRINSLGMNLADGVTLATLAKHLRATEQRLWRASPIVDGHLQEGDWREIRNPSDHRHIIGQVCEANAALVAPVLGRAARAQPGWDSTPATIRAQILERAADLFEQERLDLIALCVREAGKTLPDALGEVREAVDYLRYYAHCAREQVNTPLRLPGPTGEANELRLRGRGVFACISPWNFPLAIFTGQAAAALVAGNAVVAKPAEQTPLIAAQAIRLLHLAGIPPEVLHLMPGGGETVGSALTADPRVAGVAFTGSTEAAKMIHRTLAARDGPIPVLIAETGGQNAMIADSSALPEQVVLDAVTSACNSAGQRCSALRVLFVQQEIAPRVLRLLAGYMDELCIGDPGLPSTDVGPVIDGQAKQTLEAHKAWIKTQGTTIREVPLPRDCEYGTFVAPLAVEIPTLDLLTREVFGPVLHVVRFRADTLDAVIDSINRTGYGLTLGIHSRIEKRAQHIASRCRVGNVYINRNMIGAVVGVQPFGGQGLSGTGPKAGGPHYLQRFCTEQTVSINTAAVGGDATLLSLRES
jgi:RHH-type proline utilization regulon transcriptional repressor/proline dehydrogenase/delta 1-pyrroline-5-carboxylate dehydrogenase